MTGTKVLKNNSIIRVSETNHNTGFSVSSEIAPEVKMATINNTKVPLFPTKQGYEYFVFRTAKRA